MEQQCFEAPHLKGLEVDQAALVISLFLKGKCSQGVRIKTCWGEYLALPPGLEHWPRCKLCFLSLSMAVQDQAGGI